MNEIIFLWFFSLAMFVVYAHFLYEGTLIEKVKFIAIFMGAFTLACYFVGM